MVNNIDYLAEENRYRVCPNDGRILEFYKNHYEAVYVLLHPFYCSDIINFDEVTNETWPCDLELSQNCKSLLWSEILDLTNLDGISQIDCGLRTVIGGLLDQFKSDEYASELVKLYSRYKILLPDSTGMISPFIFEKLFSSLKEIGYEHLLFIDEFCLAEAVPRDLEKIIYGVDIERGSYYSADNTLLITSHWDSPCSFMCGVKQELDKIIKISGLEGFYCTSNTEVYWGVYEM